MPKLWQDSPNIRVVRYQDRMTNEAKSAMLQMLTGIVYSLVDNPKDVTIQLVEAEGGGTFRISTHPADVGRLMGVDGRTVHAIRVVVNASAAKCGCGRFDIGIVPSEAG